MAEKPMPMYQWEVKAILDGRKTQTRRLVNKDIVNGFDLERDGSIYMYVDQATGDSYMPEEICPYQIGDILWVRETWAKISDWTIVDPEVGLPDGYIYKADWGCGVEHPRWKPSIHMPREAARIFLEVTEVRVERLQEISGRDVLAEGADNGKSNPAMGERWENMQRMAFQELWDSIYSKRGFGWEQNPWVWVISFKRVERQGKVGG